jgi:plasmid stabilization system protein ParE
VAAKDSHVDDALAAAYAVAAQRDPRAGGTLDRLRAARPDLGPSPGGEIRSVAMQGYVILFRYLPDRLQIIRILHGQRDLPATVRPPEPMHED